MPDIEVNCGKCGCAFEVPESEGGLITPCPDCGAEISVPMPSGGLRPRSPLRVRRDTIVSGGPQCPGCKAAMAEGTVVCAHCGFDLRTGSRTPYTPPAKKALWPWFAAAVTVLVVSGLFWVFLLKDLPADDSAAAVGSPADSAAAGTSAVPASLPPLDLSMGDSPAATASQPDPAASALFAAEAARLEAEMRLRVRRELDKRYPLHSIGDSVVLRRTSGMVHRGVLQEIRADRVIVKTGPDRVEVPLTALDNASRVRCDRAYRERLIEHQARRQAQSL